MLKRLLLVTTTIICLSGQILAQSAAQKGAVQVNATVQPTSITLSWPNYSGATGYTIYRKLKSSSSWGSAIGTTSLNSFVDPGPITGEYYEYKVVRASSTGTGYGYIASGREVAPVDYRGRMILVVENQLAAPLAAQLTQLEEDFVLDGWSVSRINVDTWASSPSLKASIQAIYNADPNTKAVFLFGHVPIPYSGNLAPDGHSNHTGPWPADGYFGDLNGTWTDNSVNANGNTPGDGKFDQSTYPSDLELQVGRVDFWYQGSYSIVGLTGYQGTPPVLYSNYLTRLHEFKTRQFVPQFRGAVFDNFEDNTYGFAACGYRSISANVGTNNLSDLNGNGAPFTTYVNNQSYLWTYSCGGGGMTSCSNVATSYDMTTLAVSWGGVFNMMFGSYFGDWNNYDCLLITPLGSGRALTNAWAGSPYWWFHHMAMGDNIGYSTLVSMNNGSVYTPHNSGFLGGNTNRVHMGLMGDPSLRQVMVNMPSNLQVTSVGGNFSFSWQPASGVNGYHLYEIGSNGVITRITNSIVTATNFTSNIPYTQGKVFMVRSVMLETAPTGTYYNLSLGSKAVAPAATSVIRLSAKVMLGGPYNAQSNLMIDSLRTRQLIPVVQPYTALGYVHTANNRTEQIASSVLNTTGANAIVDWILIELRNPSTNAVVGSRTGLLQRDGDVVEIDGISPLEFDLPAANYKVAVRHRNHLAVMTNGSIALSSTAAVVNFNTTTLYGTTPRAANGTLWPGDVNFNGTVQYVGIGNDRDLVLANLNGDVQAVANTFYSGADVNLDGQIKYTGINNDRDPILVTIGGATPNNVKLQQIP